MKTFLTVTTIAAQSLNAALASSHREAPLITSTPKLDCTDFYLFGSYEPTREGYVTLVANYIPLQVVCGGPNWHQQSQGWHNSFHQTSGQRWQQDLPQLLRIRGRLHLRYRASWHRKERPCFRRPTQGSLRGQSGRDF